jgi:hypothetical protein
MARFCPSDFDPPLNTWSTTAVYTSTTTDETGKVAVLPLVGLTSFISIILTGRRR